MSSEIVDNINKIGSECVGNTGGSERLQFQNRSRISVVKRQRRVWIIGGCISLFPPLIVGLVRFFMQEASLAIIVATLSSTSIMYTGITLIVSAINDLDFGSERQEVREMADTLFCRYLVILVLFVMLYGVVEVISSIGNPVSGIQGKFRTGFIIFMNFICVIVPLWFGWKQYTGSLSFLSKEA